MAFDRELLDAVAREPEVTLTTKGRKSGKSRRVTLWITTDGSHVYIRSGQGMAREWPQNLVAAGEGTLRIGGKDMKVRPRQVSDPEEARATSHLALKKYGAYVKPSQPGQPLTKGEQAVFELLPAS
jgi:deazaflavin-dependent oxidoreductase (nitroreductase family)